MALPGRIDLNDLLVFQALAETGSFTAAARRLGVATAKVSVEIGRLEDKLGLVLFSRTTRRVAMSDAGQALYEECRPLLQGLGEALERAGAGKDELSGALRISTTVDHASLSLAPALAEFARLHPHLSIDLRTSDRVLDLVEEGIDLTIRLGWLRDSSQRAVKLAGFEQYLLAAPAFLASLPAPASPQDLAGVDWIALTLMPTPLTWRFTGPGGAVQTVHFKSRIRVDAPGAMRALVESGAGMSVLDAFSAAEGMRTGRLVRLLPEWSLPDAGVHAVYPSGRLVPGKVRSFIDFYRAYLARPSSAKA